MNEVFLKELIESQFPQFTHDKIVPVAHQGHDHRTYLLGDKFLIRICSHSRYRYQVVKEHWFLSRFKPYIDLSIPTYRYLGKPSHLFPYPFGILYYLNGEQKSYLDHSSQLQVATVINHFLEQLHSVNTDNGITFGKHNFYRGGPIEIYASEAYAAIRQLPYPQGILCDIMVVATMQPLEASLVWVHGDLDLSNLLFVNHQCSAVIDFGGIAVGDPSCDYAFGYLALDQEARDIFFENIPIEIRLKARGWALWKAAISLIEPSLSPALRFKYEQVIHRLLEDAR